MCKWLTKKNYANVYVQEKSSKTTSTSQTSASRLVEVTVTGDILQWHHNEHDDASNHKPHDCLLNRLFRRKSNKTSKLRVIGLCAVTGEFPAQMASNAEAPLLNVYFIHVIRLVILLFSKLILVSGCTKHAIIFLNPY